MKRYPRLVSGALMVTLAILPTRLAHADSVQDQIIQQQRDECKSLGGRHEYPKCYLPKQDNSKSETGQSTCGFWCKAAIVAIGGAAYCAANPGKC